MCNNIYNKNLFQSKFSECAHLASKWNILEQPCHTKLPGRAFCDTVKYNYTDMIKFPIPKHYNVGRFESMLEVTIAKVNRTTWVTEQLIQPLLKVSTYKMIIPILTFPVPLWPKSLLRQWLSPGFQTKPEAFICRVQFCSNWHYGQDFHCFNETKISFLFSIMQFFTWIFFSLINILVANIVYCCNLLYCEF